MPTLKILLDDETLDRLMEAAVRELRPIGLQASAILRRSLGLPVPYPATEDVEPHRGEDEADGGTA